MTTSPGCAAVVVAAQATSAETSAEMSAIFQAAFVGRRIVSAGARQMTPAIDRHRRPGQPAGVGRSQEEYQRSTSSGCPALPVGPAMLKRSYASSSMPPGVQLGHHDAGADSVHADAVARDSSAEQRVSWSTADLLAQ